MSDELDDAVERLQGTLDWITYAKVLQEADPWTRFLRSIQDPDVREWFEETQRARHLLISHMQRLFVETDRARIAKHADYIRENALVVAMRWRQATEALVHWMERQVDPIVVPVLDYPGKKR